MTPRQQEFIDAYKRELRAHYEWARDEAKLERYIASVIGTITTDRKTWTCDGDMLTAACRSIGLKGAITLRALRAL